MRLAILARTIDAMDTARTPRKFKMGGVEMKFFDNLFGAKSLGDAAKSGDLEGVRNLLSGGHRPNTPENRYSLLYACENGYLEIVKALVNAGADHNGVDNFGSGLTALTLATGNNHFEIANFLLERGADANAFGFGQERTPLMAATYNGNHRLMSLLLGKGANPNHLGKDGWTALLFAVANKDLAAAQLLVDNGADPNAVCFEGISSAWSMAQIKQDEKMTELLARRGAITPASHPISQFDDSVLGLALDMLGNKLSKLNLRFSEFNTDTKQNRVNTVFLLLSSSLLGNMACVDGFPSKQELALAGSLIEAFQMPYGQKNIMERLFKCPVMEPSVAGDVTNTFRIELDAYHKVFGHDPTMIGTLAMFLFDMAHADGPPVAAEQNLLELVMTIFRLSRSDYEFYGDENAQSHQKSSTIDACYSVLRSKPSDSDEYIKQQYRKLAKDYHPDVIQGKGLPEDFIKFANVRFQEIQQAYEKVMESRQR